MAKYNDKLPQILAFAKTHNIKDMAEAKKAFERSLRGDQPKGKRGRPDGWVAPVIKALFFNGEGHLVATEECSDTTTGREGAIFSAVSAHEDLLSAGTVVYTRPARKVINVKTGDITLDYALISHSMDLTTGQETRDLPSQDDGESDDGEGEASESAAAE